MQRPRRFEGKWGGECTGYFLVDPVFPNLLGVDMDAGTLDLMLHGPDYLSNAGTVVSTFVSDTGQTAFTAGPFKQGHRVVPFDRTRLPAGTYDRVDLTWNMSSPASGGQDVLPSPISVLGKVFYSEYSVPVESACSPSGTKTRYVVHDLVTCATESADFNARFISRTNLNGTGRSSSYGLIKPASATRVMKACKGKLPPDANPSNTVLQVSSVTGYCGTKLTPGRSVAVGARQIGGLLKCGSGITLVDSDQANFGSREAADVCPFCFGARPGLDGHSESFSSRQNCLGHEIGDIGVKWSVKQ
jgi:hypothetical protein